MNEYTFILKFRLPDPNADPDRYIDALAEGGCDDALVGVGLRGRIALDFTREGTDALEAVSSAIRDVKRAIPGAELVEASPDLVGLTDVADIAGFSRQNMRKLMTGHVASFPDAIHEGTPSLWHLAPVLAWLRDRQQRPVDPKLLEIASIAMQLNIAREIRRLPGASLPKELATLFA